MCLDPIIILFRVTIKHQLVKFFLYSIHFIFWYFISFKQVSCIEFFVQVLNSNCWIYFLLKHLIELLFFVEVFQCLLKRVLVNVNFFVFIDSLRLQIIFKTFDKFGSVFVFMISKLFLIQKSHIPQILEQFLSSIEPLLVSFNIKSIKFENFINFITNIKLNFQMFVKSQCENSLCGDFDLFCRQKKSQKCTNSTVWFIESSKLKLVIILYKTIIHLFIFVDRVYGWVIVENILFHF